MYMYISITFLYISLSLYIYIYREREREREREKCFALQDWPGLFLLYSGIVQYNTVYYIIQYLVISLIYY